MTPMEQARLIIDRPRRDWRFWAGVSAALLSACVTIAFVSVVLDRNDYSERFRDASEQQTCRSAAAVFSDTAQAQQLIVQGAALAAVGRGQSPVAFADALEVASDNALTALRLRDDALTRCSVDPTYRISDAELRDLPDYPRPTEQAPGD